MAAPEISGGETTKSKIVYGDKVLIDLTEDTVTPATLKSGVTAHDASGSKITGTLDTTPPEESDINFWDYEGTLLYAWTLAELATKTELPPLPSHDGLVCQGWNWTLQDIKDAGRELDIGALYITDDGKTRLYVDVDTETWDDFVLNYWQSNINTTTVDWGDGTTPETKNASSWIEHRHVYAASGSYVITMSVKEGKTMWLGHDGRMLIANGETDSGRCAMLRRVEVGARVVATDPQCFRNCCRLESISLPQSTKVYADRAFELCTQLRVLIAADMDEIGQTFYHCSNLRAIATPKGTTQRDDSAIASTAIRQINFDITTGTFAEALKRVHIKAVNGQVGDFSACRALLEVTIPADATTFVSAAFQGDNALRRVTCLGNIASIPAQVFQRCYPLRFVDFTNCTAVPTLANVNAFDRTHAQLEIRVPASLADAWKTATNWSSLADHIVGV
nr:MAG TPA: tail protein [Bacteriophage sp.]